MKIFKLLLLIIFFNNSIMAEDHARISLARNKFTDTIGYRSLQNMLSDYDSLLVIRAFISLTMNHDSLSKIEFKENYNYSNDFGKNINLKSKMYYIKHFDSLLNNHAQDKVKIISQIHYWCLNYSFLLSVTKLVETYNDNDNLATLVESVSDLKHLLQKYVGKNQYWGSLDSDSLGFLFYDVLNYISSLSIKQQLILNSKMVHSIINL